MEKGKRFVLVNNRKALDVGAGKIRPLIKDVKCELLRTIEVGLSISSNIYVVEFNGTEVYLSRHEIKFLD